VHGIGKGSYEDHEKMVIAYQNEPEEYRRQTEKYIKKLAIDQTPSEQSIAVRGRERPPGAKNKPRDVSVDIPPKPKSLGDITMITRMGAATKPPTGAAKETKSPLLRRVKDLE